MTQEEFTYMASEIRITPISSGNSSEKRYSYHRQQNQGRCIDLAGGDTARYFLRLPKFPHPFLMYRE